MIKYEKFLFAIVCTFILGFTTVEAARNVCPNSVKKELAQKANYVKVNYEIKDFSEFKELVIGDAKTTYKVPNYVFEISIYNMDDDIYVSIEKTNGEMGMTIYNTDAEDGIYTFTDTNIGDIYNYNFTIRSNNEQCMGTVLRTTKFTKPRYNAYSEFTYCKNSSNFYCQRFIGTEINLKSADEFLNKVSVNNEKNNPKRDEIEEKNEISDLLKKNWKTYVLVFVLVLGVIVGGAFFLKKYNEKKGWRL